MARAGTARTDRAGVARFDFRVGALSQAGLLLQEHSLGVIQSVGVSAERSTVMLKSGTPQQTVAVETISSDMIFTANINEKSKRNINLFLNTGIADYDDTRTETFNVNNITTGVPVNADSTSITLSTASFTEKVQKALLSLNGATSAQAMWDKIDGLTGLTPAHAVAAFNMMDDVVFNSKIQTASYTAFLKGQKASEAILTAGTACTDALQTMPAGVLSSAYTALNAVKVTDQTAATNFLFGFKSVKLAFDNAGSVAAAYIAAGAVTSTVEIATITFKATTSLASGKLITIAGRTITLGTAATAAHIAEAFVSGNTTPVGGATPSGTLAGYTATRVGAVVTLVSTTPSSNVSDLTVGGTISDVTAQVPTITSEQGGLTTLAHDAGITAAQLFITELGAYDAAGTTQSELKAVIQAVYNAASEIAVGTETTGLITTSIKTDYVVGINLISKVYTKLAESATGMQTAKVLMNELMDLLVAQTESYFLGGIYFSSMSAGFKYVQNKTSAYLKDFPVAALDSYMAQVVDPSVADKQTAYDTAGISAGTYVLYDNDDPMTLAVINIESFVKSTGVATLKAGTTVGTDFPSTANLIMYKANVIAPLRDFSMPYYSVRLVELDAKTRAPEVTDIWKCAITSGSNMTLSSTDFSAWDVVLTSVYPTISDMRGDLAHVKDKINAYGACARYMLNDI